MNTSASGRESSPQVFYEVAMNRLDAQMNRMEAIDRKLASIIGFSSIIIAIFAAVLQLGGLTQLPLYAIAPLILAAASYVALLVFAVRAYRFQEWDFRPNLKELDEYCAEYGDSLMREWVARECITAYKDNEKKLSSKTSDGRKALWLLFTETVLLVVVVSLALACALPNAQ